MLWSSHTLLAAEMGGGGDSGASQRGDIVARLGIPDKCT